VNLIGEHIDYLGLAVLPMAIDRAVRMAVRPRDDDRIRVRNVSPAFEPVEFDLASDPPRHPDGHWANYLKAAASVASGFGATSGVDALVISDLPVASGLSSSSALVVAMTLSLLDSNGTWVPRLELARAVADGERYVGTAGGGMDQAACLLGQRGHALHLRFDPLGAEPVAVPDDWVVIVAESGTPSEKSGAVRDRYNAIRAAAESGADPDVSRHIRTEPLRVDEAVEALRAGDGPAFGRLMTESHDSLRNDLRVSTDRLDEIVSAAMDGGALGARLTGAGFGGCAIALTTPERRDRVIASIPAPAFQIFPGPGAEVIPL
jgi:galactokinase